MTTKKQILLAAAVAAPLLVGGLANRFIETDGEAVRHVTEECARACLTGQPNAVLSHLSSNAQGKGEVGKGPLARQVRHWVSLYGRRLRDLSLHAREVKVIGDAARATYEISGRLRHEWRRGFDFVARIGYRREHDEWLINRVDVGGRGILRRLFSFGPGRR